MKKLILSLGVAIPLLCLSGCATVTAVSYDTGYVGATNVYASDVSYVDYDYGYGSWYAGGPDYYNTAIYNTDW